ncbi:MAG: hypothetical protein AAGH43_01580 [Pseudomonadota bacterium]
MEKFYGSVMKRISSAKKIRISIKRKIDKYKIGKFASKNKFLIKPGEFNNIYFFQHNELNIKYIEEKGLPPLPRILDMPHVRAARDMLNRKDSIGIEEYKYYLKNFSLLSLKKDKNRHITDRVESFEKLVMSNSIHKIDEPIVTIEPKTERILVLDGNHRIARYLARNEPFSVKFISLDMAIVRYLSSDHYYSTSEDNKPYQTIYVHRQPIVQGRRMDCYNRLDMFPDYVFDGKNVLDVGSNIGMNAVAVRQKGANAVVGVEPIKKNISLSYRIASLNDLFTNIKFVEETFNYKQISDYDYETVILFSIIKHLDDLKDVKRLFKSENLKYICVEGHPGQSIDEIIHMINPPEDFLVTELGRLDYSHERPDKARRGVWLLERK